MIVLGLFIPHPLSHILSLVVKERAEKQMVIKEIREAG